MAEREGLFALRAHPVGAAGIAGVLRGCAARRTQLIGTLGFESTGENSWEKGHKTPFPMNGGEGGIIRAARSPRRGRRHSRRASRLRRSSNPTDWNTRVRIHRRKFMGKGAQDPFSHEWRRGRDSNPRGALCPQPISSRCRCDRFGTSPVNPGLIYGTNLTSGTCRSGDRSGMITIQCIRDID